MQRLGRDVVDYVHEPQHISLYLGLAAGALPAELEVAPQHVDALRVAKGVQLLAEVLTHGRGAALGVIGGTCGDRIPSRAGDGAKLAQLRGYAAYEELGAHGAHEVRAHAQERHAVGHRVQRNRGDDDEPRGRRHLLDPAQEPKGAVIKRREQGDEDPHPLERDCAEGVPTTCRDKEAGIGQRLAHPLGDKLALEILRPADHDVIHA